MLLQKQQTLPYIGVFKLNSGEEFIAEVTEESAVSFTVSKPLCMVPTEKGLQFAPFIMMGDLDSDVTIPKPVIQASPNKAIRDQYATSVSPIAMPKKQSIIV